MSVPLDMLVHPELLSNQQLITVIHERHLRIPNVQNLPRDELLDVFHNYCVPYGQRKYRDKGRGKILNKTRHMSPEPSTNLNINNGYKFCNHQSDKFCSDHNDRLKPPPDTLAGHMKRIKIATIAVPISDSNGLKRKITMNSDITESETPPQKKDRKPITWP